jgi:amino acid permease
MKSLFKCIAIGVFYGVVIGILLKIFSEYISEENEMLFIVGITAVLFPLIDLIAKKLKSNRGIEG